MVVAWGPSAVRTARLKRNRSSGWEADPRAALIAASSPLPASTATPWKRRVALPDKSSLAELNNGKKWRLMGGLPEGQHLRRRCKQRNREPCHFLCGRK